MILRQTLEKATGGYWDGGERAIFDWETQNPTFKDDKGEFIKVGLWEANTWFYVTVGKTKKQTLANARRKLTARMKQRGLNCTFEYLGCS